MYSLPIFKKEIITDIPLHGGVCHKIPHVSAVFKSTPAFPLNPYATPGEDTCQEASSGQKKIINLCMSRTRVRDTLPSVRDIHYFCMGNGKSMLRFIIRV